MHVRQLIEEAHSHSSALKPLTDKPIVGAWNIDLAFRPSALERTFRHRIISFMIDKQGASYCDPAYHADIMPLIGLPFSEAIQDQPLPVTVALVDSLYGSVPAAVAHTHSSFSGHAEAKSTTRARLMIDALEETCPLRRPLRVLHIGVVKAAVREMRNRGHTVYATDMDTSVIGTQCGDVTVWSGQRNEQLIQEVDIVLATGMTLSNGTFDELSRDTLGSNVPLMLFAETGSHLSKHLCARGAISSAFCEPFPFYIFQGSTDVEFVKGRR